MRILITGGGGFVGSHLVDLLSEEGHEILILDFISNHKNLDHLIKRKNITHYFADISEPDILPKLIQKDDWVIHLAAQSHVDVSFLKPHKTILSNVLATHNVLESSRRNGAEKVLIMSTDEVYGSVETIDDVHSLNPTNPYSASKAAADMITNSFKHMYPNLHINTLRSNNIAGPRQYIRNIIPRFSCLGILGKKMTLHGDGSSRRRYLWVKDAALAISLIIKGGKPGKIYHTSHPESYSNLEVANKIGSYLGLKDFVELVDDRVYNDTTYPAFDQLDIKTDLGWEVTKDIDDFLPETIDWYKKNINLFKEYLT
ncbi:MAG: dTDP-glucose 4,6-dehydratase [Chloroflexi bacterium]|nr:dTDP-glucose 4,6-dehydratase [Chloroflexota bacterium]|tara:strand:+ start:376 stop:1317 length:942 start_codon:yes stop_codon:yes gene_type:complete